MRIYSKIFINFNLILLYPLDELADKTSVLLLQMEMQIHFSFQS